MDTTDRNEMPAATTVLGRNIEEIARQVSKLVGLEIEPWRMRFVDAVNENPHVLEELWEVTP